jgi:hypothetical protein
MGRDSVVSMGTRYGLDGSWIGFRRGQDFPYPFIPALGFTQLPVQWILGLFPGAKKAGA